MSDMFVAEIAGKPFKQKGELFLFNGLSACKSFIRQQAEGHKPRRATETELASGKLIEVRESDGISVDPTVSNGTRNGLVSLHEDLGGRRFAISSRAASESEFIFEASNALANLPDVGPTLLDVRYREFLPLIVDMCCKYRGYKADRVQESVLLVAGDLDMPK
jgi:hypothetical protein